MKVVLKNMRVEERGLAINPALKNDLKIQVAWDQILWKVTVEGGLTLPSLAKIQKPKSGYWKRQGRDITLNLGSFVRFWGVIAPQTSPSEALKECFFAGF